MQFLSRENLLQWKARLPDDVVSCLTDITEEGQAEADIIQLKLPEFQDSEAFATDVMSLVVANEDKFIAMGRTRRIRFLAWCTAKLYADKVTRERLMMALTGGNDTDEESGGGREKIAPYFQKDIEAFVEALGPRATALIVDQNTLSTIAGVGFELASNMDMRGGR